MEMRESIEVEIDEKNKFTSAPKHFERNQSDYNL